MNKCTGSILLALLFTSLAGGSAGQAKLGEEISKYQQKVARAYTSKGQSTKDGKTYYMFAINVDQQVKQVVPEFGGGLTITVLNGKIVGQSMVLRLGKSVEVAKTIAVRYALDFAFESLGRSVPKDIAGEVGSYTTVINNAMGGDPQYIRYPGVTGKITVTKQKDGSLVFAATPG